jgi:hypothetical protein
VTVASLGDYLPLGDLAKIVVVCLGVAVAAPAAVSLGIVGLDLRERSTSRVSGTVLVALGVLVVAALIAIGLYALFTD